MLIAPRIRMKHCDIHYWQAGQFLSRCLVYWDGTPKIVKATFLDAVWHFRHTNEGEMNVKRREEYERKKEKLNG